MNIRRKIPLTAGFVVIISIVCFFDVSGVLAAVSPSFLGEPQVNEVNKYEVTVKAESTAPLFVGDTDIVLALDVSDSMDLSVAGDNSRVDDFYQNSRWSALKASVGTFIDTVVTKNSQVKVGIVVYRGYNSKGEDNPKSDGQILAAFSADASELKNSYCHYKYASAANTGGSETSLREAVFPNDVSDYGESNVAVGFQTAKELLTTSQAKNKVVIMVAGGAANVSAPSSDDAVASAIKEGKALKAAYPNLQLFTMGFAAGDFKALNPVDEENQYQDGFYTAGNAQVLTESFMSIAPNVVSSAMIIAEIEPGFKIEQNSVRDANADIDIGSNLMWFITNLTADNSLTFTIKADNKMKKQSLNNPRQSVFLSFPEFTNSAFAVFKNVPLNLSIVTAGSQQLNTKVTVIDGPTNGKLSIHGDDTVTYMPNQDFLGKDYFSYGFSKVKAEKKEPTPKITVEISITVKN